MLRRCPLGIESVGVEGGVFVVPTILLDSVSPDFICDVNPWLTFPEPNSGFSGDNGETTFTGTPAGD